MGEREALAERVEDREIQLVIGDGEHWREDLSREAEALRREYQELGESIYQYVAWKNSSLTQGGRGAGAEDVVLRTVLRKEEELYRCRRELAAAIADLEEKRIRLERIRVAYTLLPRREYQVLQELYERRTTWAELPRALGLSKQNVCRLRAAAFAHIRQAVLRQEAIGAAPEGKVAEKPWHYGREEPGNSACIQGGKPYNGL